VSGGTGGSQRPSSICVVTGESAPGWLRKSAAIAWRGLVVGTLVAGYMGKDGAEGTDSEEPVAAQAPA